MTDIAPQTSEPCSAEGRAVTVIGKLCTVACFVFASLGVGFLAMANANQKAAVVGIAIGIAIVPAVFLVFVYWMLRHSAAKGTLHHEA